jgi:ADP-sugar diphosphatase
MTFTELPAGMLDDGTFSGTAAKEIEEECGIKVPEADLIDLTALAISANSSDSAASDFGIKLGEGVYPSVGACDEYMAFFLYEKKVSRKEIQEWQGKLTGLRDEGEKITLKIVKLQDLWKEGARDAKAMCALALYTSLKQHGKI